MSKDYLKLIVVYGSFFNVLASPIWWKKCEILEMSHTLSDKAINFPIKKYEDNRFKSTTLAKGITVILYLTANFTTASWYPLKSVFWELD